MEVAMPSRRQQKAVRSTDPGQSAWWLLPSAGGIIAGGIGAVASQTLTHNAVGSAMVGAVSGTVAGLGAATPQLRDWISARFHRQQITDTAGVLKNGIENKYVSHKDLYSLRVHRSNRNDITDFVHRDIQDQLVEHLRNRIPVLIEGTSMAGKTRLAIETIRSQWPSTYCWFPLGPGDIEELLNSNQQPPPESVIILDDLDRFLSNQSLTLSQLNRWVNNSCIIVATMMHSQYVKHSDRSNEKVVGWDVVNRFERLTLSPSLSTKELNDVRHTSYANQLSQIENVGLGPLLGCAEAVRTAFTDELEKHSWCGALIKAAADWRRIGLGPASRDQLTSLSLSHNNDVWETVDWDDTWKEATRLINHTVPLLRQVGEDRWEVLDTIADEADWKISEHTFAALQNITLSAQQTLQSALTMLTEGASPSSTNAMFQRAIDADPEIDATVLGAYAIFLDTVRGDMGQAEQMYQRAIDSDPEIDATVLGAYAIFLETVRDDMGQAEQMYQRAITADPHHATNLGAYAIFLETVRDDMGQAEQMYQQAITTDPHHANNLGNYANFLKNIRGDMDQAQDMYQQAIDADPHHATNLGNYAIFLHTVRGDMDQAQDMYQQAITADPHHATNLGNYAIFLKNIRGDMDQAEQMYQQAITADPHNANNLGNYAIFLKNIRGDMDQAEQMYQQAITADPHNANNLGNYAQFLFVKADDMKAISLTKKAISFAGNDEKSLLAECHFYLFAHSPKHRKDSGGALKTLLAEGVTTGDWSFEMNLERLRHEEDPRLELLEAVAQALRDGDMSRLNAFEEWRDL
ncbi:tetratricopeptide repeat protein [Actinomyces oris]|uniref:tetratricopeptide repeat protein n=1 Tax=Actinomyces oris TaxID=544580 RepID=UPI002852CB52|nr:tetratricopeptide repeat protein [Actinomyces oris]